MSIHGVTLSGCMLTLLLATVGCGSNAATDADLRTELQFASAPPVVGDAKATLTLADAEGKPLKGATVKLEGNMNHAGMKPSFADLVENAPGEYAGTLEFTMAGDWFVLVTGQTADGKRIEKKFDVKGVKAK